MPLKIPVRPPPCQDTPAVEGDSGKAGPKMIPSTARVGQKETVLNLPVTITVQKPVNPVKRLVIFDVNRVLLWSEQSDGAII